VLTSPFGNQVRRATAYQPSDRPFPYIVIDHPIQMISAEETEKRAAQLVAAIEKLLNDEIPTY
jgi:hypothetical protein